MFKFLDTDSRNVTKEGRVIDDKVQETLMEFAPGLINVQVSADTDVFDDQFTSRGNHRNLISASPFNVSTLFHPTLVFIERACATIPPEFDEEPRSIGGVLEEFVVKVFLPRLDDQVTIAFQNAISGEVSLSSAADRRARRFRAGRGDVGQTSAEGESTWLSG